MQIRACMTILVLASLGGSPADDALHLTARKEGWQKLLDQEPFKFSDHEVGVMFALSQYEGDCQVHMIHDPEKWAGNDKTFEFVRGGKRVVTIEGHAESTFRIEANILYFAQFPRGSFGCIMTAFDLATGKKVWETRLEAVGMPPHSIYGNKVTMSLARRSDLETDEEGTVSITGSESNGDYVEILDRKTGERLAHKIYRDGFKPR